MIQVADLIIYPVKSLQGVSVAEAEVLERGFKHDRRWMIVDKQGLCVTQRTHPQLSQIIVSIDQEGIHLSVKGSAMRLTTSVARKPRKVIVWDDRVSALEAESAQNEWISGFLSEACSFVFMPEDGKRAVNPQRAQNKENVSFADGYPYLILGETSLEDLNSRLESPIPMNRFRPNIVVSGSMAYEEDHWREMKIGDIQFYGTHPCKRCVFTTINQETGEKGIEPLKTLATYRREGSEIIFGLNALASSRGKIRIGDELSLI